MHGAKHLLSMESSGTKKSGRMRLEDRNQLSDSHITTHRRSSIISKARTNPSSFSNAMAMQVETSRHMEASAISGLNTRKSGEFWRADATLEPVDEANSNENTNRRPIFNRDDVYVEF